MDKLRDAEGRPDHDPGPADPPTRTALHPRVEVGVPRPPAVRPSGQRLRPPLRASRASARRHPGHDGTVATGQIGPDLGVAEAAVEGERRHGRGLTRCQLHDQGAARARAIGAPPRTSTRRSSRPSCARRTALLTAPSPGRPAAARRRSRRRAGWRPRRRRHPRARRAARRTSSPRRCGPAWRPDPGRRGWPGPRRATPADTSVSHTSTRSRSAATERPMAPDPVPRSTATSGRPRSATSGRRRSSSSRATPATTSVSGRRDQHPAVDQQVEGAEAPPADDVLERLAGETTLEHRVEVVHPPLGGGLVEREHVLGSFGTRRPLDDAPGVEAGRAGIDLDRRRPDGARPRRASMRHETAPSGQLRWCHASSSRSRSCRDRSSATRASTTSSRSPASTLSSL